MKFLDTVKQRSGKRMAINLFKKFIGNINKVESNARKGKVGKLDLLVMRSHLLLLSQTVQAEKTQEDKADVLEAVVLCTEICERIDEKRFGEDFIKNLSDLREWYRKSIESFKKE